MKAGICIVAMSLLVGAAIAQESGSQSPQQTRPGQGGDPPAMPQTRPGQTGEPSTMPQTQPVQRPSDDQGMGKSSSSQSTPAEMKTQTYKGVLVDMSCAGGGSSASANPSPGGESANRSDTSAAGSEKKNTADRSAAGSCPVTANSSQFGLKTKDGKTLRFDLVGNQRAQEALKNNKKWNKEMTDGKEVNATVKGAISGDKLIVSAIH
jgi:hypothetical protein